MCFTFRAIHDPLADVYYSKRYFLWEALAVYVASTIYDRMCAYTHGFLANYQHSATLQVQPPGDLTPIYRFLRLVVTLITRCHHQLGA